MLRSLFAFCISVLLLVDLGFGQGHDREASALIPMPASVETLAGAPLRVGGATPVLVEGDDPAAHRVGRYLDALLGPVAREMWRSPTQLAQGPDPEAEPLAPIRLRLSPARADLGGEGYRLDVRAEGALVEAATPAGLFYGVQTLRQLLPPRVEYGASLAGPMEVAPVRVEDRPRFAWRGAMLDVARHFFSVDEVKRYLDLMALYKLNRLHLHLSDDQGWRIEIPGHPALTDVGGRLEVGGGPGGFYTVEDYGELVRYAADRFIEIVPEIDLPGHTNAALVALPELNCDGQARAPYTGIVVGFSTVCVENEATYDLVDDVVRELAAMTPGPYLHLGGDEVQELSPAQYAAFMTRAQAIVRRHGKHFVGWDEVAEVDLELLPGTLVQVWRPQSPETARHLAGAVAQGARLILSPAEHVYLDMKYDSTTVLGLSWAGTSDVRDAYEWEPASLVEGVGEEAVVGVEAPLWTETIANVHDLEWMAFPRLLGVAEAGWSPPAGRTWAEYRQRLARHGPRLTALGVNFYRSPLVAWPPDGRVGE